MELLSKPTLTPCSGLFTSSHGLPCAHELKRLLGIQEVLLLNHFHPHWHLKRSQQPQEPILQPLRSVQEIERVSTIPASSTRREPSGFELVEAAIIAAAKCSKCNQVGHNRRSLICPLRHSELIALRSTIQPIPDAAPATPIIQSTQESTAITEETLYAVMTQYQKDPTPECSQELILQPLRSVQQIERVSTIPASSTRREPSGFEPVQATIKAPMKYGRYHQVGHSKRQLICPLQYSELIALSSSTTIQPLLDAAPATQIVQSVQESATEASLHAVITQYQKDAMPESSLVARESPESSLVASPGKSPPWRARDFERGTVRAHFDAKEAEMEEYYSGFITQHGHLPQGSEDRYKKYDLRRRR